MLLDVQARSCYAYTGGKPFDPRSPTVVFVHGAQHDHSVWALQSRYFAHHGFSVLAVDLPGHGRSGGTPLSTIEALADWLSALLDAAGVEQAALVGHSMGALICLEAAARHPNRVHKLALLGVAYPMKVSPALLETSLHDEPQAIEMVNIWSHSGIAQKPSFPGPGFYAQAVNQRLMQRVSARNEAPVFHTDFVACNAYAHGEEAAAAIRCPTLFLLARKDLMTPAKAAAGLVQSIPHGESALIESSGHAMMAEQPDAVLDKLISFMKK